MGLAVIRKGIGFLAVGAATAFATDAAAQAPFTEEAVARGVDYYISEIPGLSRGYGCTFADLDEDGDPDILATGALFQYIGVLENDGSGNFTDHSATCELPLIDAPSGIVALDYDGDGDLDPYVVQWGGTLGNFLARNLGDYRFELDRHAGVNDFGDGSGVAIGDYDGDGWLDMLVPNYGTADRLYHNLGDGTFEEVAADLGLDDPWRGLQAVFFDMDWDGDQDIYMSNDKKDAQETEMHNRLYENVGGTFVDISASSGTDVNIYSMGVAVGDFDGNGLQDLYCANTALEPNSLLLCATPRTYIDAQMVAGVGSYRTAWGTAFLDYDNNTFQDLFLCNRTYPAAGGENRMYVHDGSWPATDIAAVLRLDDSRNSFGLAVADVDCDGDPDLLVQNNDDQLRLYINNEGQSRNWVKFRVVGNAPNHFAVGARVSIRTGNKWQSKQVLAGGNGYLGQNELTVHFGLDTADVVDEVRVQWPDGKRRTLIGLPGNQTHDLRRQPIRRSNNPLTTADRQL